jgi:hypothetical protein
MKLQFTPLSLASVAALAVFLIAYWVSGPAAWRWCYVTSIVLALSYLWVNRARIFCITPIFVSIVTVANTLPALPYTVFELDPVRNFHRSLYVNAIGLLVVLTMACLHQRPPRPLLVHQQRFQTQEWLDFFRVNARLFYVTTPLVLVAMFVSGGWQVLLGVIPSEDFSRTGAFKGLGPLMLFAALNVYAGTVYGFSLVGRHKLIRGMVLVAFMLAINSFTLGRGNVILVFMYGLFSFALTRGITLRLMGMAFLIGIGIVLMQLFRATGEGGSDFSPLLALMLKFSADFDSLNNTAHLINYIEDAGFPGWYHIYSFIYNPIPRSLFPDKPHFFGILHLNDLIFPGMYLGEEGGTNFTFGLFGTWYGAEGMATLLFGSWISARFLCWLDDRLDRWRAQPRPDLLLVFYLFVLGQIVIFYRDGLSVFVSALVQIPLYMVCCRAFGWRPVGAPLLRWRQPIRLQRH